ncbi:Chloroperoxidase [Chytriomyces sp. MP71]|nr:Chloroperoxidase [Chytriomyces sp. MP71]
MHVKSLVLTLVLCVLSISVAAELPPDWPGRQQQQAPKKPLPRTEFVRRPWVGPKKGEARSPCPMLNALANHGHINHDGRSVGMGSIVQVLEDMWFPSALAFMQPIGMSLWMQKDQFSNHDLDKFSVWDHDASLTRHDFAISKSHKVDKKLVDQLLSFAGDKGYLTLTDLAKARRLRYAQSKAANPDFKFGLTARFFAVYESLCLMNVIGKNGKLPVDVTRDFFINERLPQKWKEHNWNIGFWGIYLSRDILWFTYLTHTVDDAVPSSAGSTKSEL